MNSKGVTLIELLAVLVIIGIIVLIAVPLYLNYIYHAEEGVCHANLHELERMYELDLQLNSMTHQDEHFTAYTLEYGPDLCPVDGILAYIDEQVQCSVHGSYSDYHDSEDDSDDGSNEDDGEVPFL